LITAKKLKLIVMKDQCGLQSWKNNAPSIYHCWCNIHISLPASRSVCSNITI